MQIHRLLIIPLLLSTLFCQPTVAKQYTHQQKNCHFDTEGKYITIGGIKQWITVQGKNCDKPVILVVHGGPGSPLSLYHNSLFKRWENAFTIAHWDQRGAGKTFEINHSATESMMQLLNTDLSVDTWVNDGLAVTDYLRKTYNTDKIILVGTSWGSFLALKMAFTAPEKYTAYLGSSPLINFHRNTAESYQLVLSIARDKKDTKSIQTLIEMGNPPWKNPKNFKKLRMIIRQYEQSLTTPLPSLNIDDAYSNEKSRQAYMTGEDFSFLTFLGLNGDGIANQVRIDECCLDYQLPIYFFQGEQDMLSTPKVTQSFFEQLSAPEKAYFVVPQTGHELNQAMLDKQFELLNKIP